MCGIAGLFHFRDDAPADPAVVERMTDRLRHRGPDDAGLYAAGPLAIGMRRLSIIDVEGGAQPMSGEDGAVRVVFNGEIYNHGELRRTLQGRGHRFRTRADTEVLVHGWEEFGPDLLPQLNGMFAFALHDARAGRLFLARDRLGIKPLYVAETASGLAFASELGALLEAPGIRRDLDPAAIQQYLAWEYIPAPRTPYAGVSKMPPATCLEVGAGFTRRTTWWRLEPGAPITDGREAQEMLRWHLARAVRLQRLADVPVGAFLSGGLDSSVLVSTLAEAGGARPRTFSIGFLEAEYDEIGAARSVAAAFRTAHQDAVLPARCTDLVERVAGFLDEPFADSSILPTYLVSALARRDVKVVLSGDGGDELFAGYDHYKADRVAAWWGRVPAPLRRAASSWSGGTPGRRLRQLEAGLALPPALEHARFMVRAPRAIAGDLLTASWRREGAEWLEPWAAAFRASPFRARLARQQHVDLRTYLADDILYKLDRASMAASLEARVPWLDHELVEYAFRLKSSLKMRGLRGKWIVRAAFRGRVPDGILRRRKRGFCVPIGAWLRDGLRPMAQDLLAPARLRRQGIFEPATVGALLREHDSQAADHARLLWALVMFQLWSDRAARSTTAGPRATAAPRGAASPIATGVPRE